MNKLGKNMKCTEPLVSVVIPTRNRPNLVARAVHSALTQSLAEIEVIVVIDGPDDTTLQVLNQIDDRRLRVSMLAQHLGVSDVRNTGVREARSQWIAFLDDDDEWLPQKLEIQLQTAQRSTYEYPIIACRIIARTPAGDFFWPLRFPRPNELLSEYVICRRNPISGEGLISPSTIFTKKELLLKIPFKSELTYYEDVDWLLCVSTQEGVGVEFVSRTEPMVICHMESNRSRITTGLDWNHYLSWIQARRHLVTPRSYASFIMTRPALFASRQGDWKAFFPLLREAYRYYMPGILDILYYLGIWLIPQKAKHLLAILFARRSRNIMWKREGG
jgi:glycosyltransferase involved in cell wall biosynthesis